MAFGRRLGLWLGVFPAEGPEGWPEGASNAKSGPLLSPPPLALLLFGFLGIVASPNGQPVSERLEAGLPLEA